MIIFINGSFGAGKTTVAKRLVECLPNAMLYDPELVGLILREMTNGIRSGVEDTDDFQDIALWRPLTGIIAGHLKATYGRTLVVPMTVTRSDYFEELKAGLTMVDADFHHFCLLASAETIHMRLVHRGETPGEWVFQQIDRCVSALAHPRFAQHIDTDNKPIDAVVEQVLLAVEA